MIYLLRNGIRIYMNPLLFSKAIGECVSFIRNISVSVPENRNGARRNSGLNENSISSSYSYGTARVSDPSPILAVWDCSSSWPAVNFSVTLSPLLSGTLTKSSDCAPFPALSREAVKEYLTSGYRPSDAPESAYLFGTFADENGLSNGDKAQEWHEMGSNALNDVVKRYVKRVTGKEVHAHTLRHAAASLWDDLGAPMRTIQNGLGHSSVRTTERIYVTVLNKHKAAEDLTAAFGG